MKELAERCEGKFNCLGKNTEKYLTFSVPIGKEVTRIDKNEQQITIPKKTKPNRLQVNSSTRFIASSLSNLVVNVSEGVRTITSAVLNTQILKMV